MPTARESLPSYPNGWRVDIGCLLTIVAIVVAAYWQALDAPFVFDDYPAIVRNASIRDLSAIGSVLNPPVTAAGAAGRPAVNLTLAFDYALHGASPRGFHLTNILLHALTACLLFVVARHTLLVWAGRDGPDSSDRSSPMGPGVARSRGAAWVIALLWAVHPLLTETVVCVIQRNEILVAASILGVLYALLRANAAKQPAPWLLLGIGLAWLGALSKEVAAVTPVLVLLFDRIFLAPNFTAIWRRRGAFYVGLAASWLLIGWLVLRNHERAGTVGFGLGTSAWQYLLTQSQAITGYLKLSLWPHPLVADYGFALAPGISAVWPYVLLVGMLLAATLLLLWRAPRCGFLAAWCFLLLAPSSSIVPLTTQTMAEHRMYLPLAGLVALAVLLAMRVNRGAWLASFVALPLLAVTTTRVGTYHTEESLWRDTVTKQPDNARAWSSLAHVFVQQDRWSEAATLYDKAVTLRPDYADTQNDYANVLLHLGRTDAALAHYRSAHRLKPDDAEIELNCAAGRAQTGDLAGATDSYRDVLGREPRNVRALNGLGDAWLKLNRPSDALAAFMQALAIEPDSAAAHNNTAVALMNLGRFTEAVSHYEAALRQMSGSALVHHNLALALDGAGRLAEAAEHEKQALELDPNFTRAREHLENLMSRPPLRDGRR